MRLPRRMTGWRIYAVGRRINHYQKNLIEEMVKFTIYTIIIRRTR